MAELIMTANAWWQSGIIYQIYPRSFKDTTGSGIGDLQGVIDQLPYLRWLGIDAIWLSPFYPSPMADFGYDVADYTDVDPMFGDLATFDGLVEAAHQHNIRIVIDYVPNHTSDEHAWFRESRSSRNNPKRDWYIWRDPKPDGSLPNNWGSSFGGVAWTWDDKTDQYYFHQFHRKQPDLNWRNPEVRAAMYDVLRFWMNRGVDGFRMDVVYMIWKHPEMPDQPLIEDATLRSESEIIGQQQQIYAFNYDGIHDVLQTMRDVLDENDVIAIGEIWLSLEERMTYYQEFEMPFNFDLLEADWDADIFKSKVEAYEAAIPAGAWPNYVLGSHDKARLSSRYGDGNEDRARVAGLLLLTLRGTPTLYMGDELGMVNGDIPEHLVQDPQGKQFGVEHTRDVCRTPMQWDSSPHGGFSNVEPWLPVNEDYRERNIQALRDDDTSILILYQRLIDYRKAHPSLSLGDYKTLESPAGTYMYQRSYEGESHLILLNFTSDDKQVTLPQAGEIVLDTTLTQSGRVEGEFQLAGDTGVVIRVS